MYQTVFHVIQVRIASLLVLHCLVEIAPKDSTAHLGLMYQIPLEVIREMVEFVLLVTSVQKALCHRFHALADLTIPFHSNPSVSCAPQVTTAPQTHPVLK